MTLVHFLRLFIPVINRFPLSYSYTSNIRTITTLKKTAFGDIIYIAVGTVMIGSVNITAEEGTILKKYVYCCMRGILHMRITAHITHAHHRAYYTRATAHIKYAHRTVRSPCGACSAFGGSTIIVIFERDKVVFAEDLENNTKKLVETYCWMGSPLAVVRNKI